MQAGKYEIQGPLVNMEKSQVVPDDVPIFILLGTDHHAPYAIANYAQMCQNNNQRNQCLAIAQAFATWQAEHPDRIHEPDGRE